MIWSFEKTHSTTCLSRCARLNSRIPVFAVSASLVEKERQKYMDAGFDGWILKPVDFKRVGLLLKGIVDDEAQKESLYQPGKWEQGGWFEDRPSQPDIHNTDARPSDEPPTNLPAPTSFPRAETVRDAVEDKRDFLLDKALHSDAALCWLYEPWSTNLSCGYWSSDLRLALAPMDTGSMKCAIWELNKSSPAT